jgi:hypothetical protein
MAYSAVECLEADGFNDMKWAEFKKTFADHVVED